MNEALRHDPSSRFENREDGIVEALEQALAALPSGQDDRRTCRLRERLQDDLFDARSKRIDRIIEENWRTLEAAAGHTLR